MGGTASSGLALFAVLLSGCTGLLGAGEVTRTVGGEARRGIFVSPYSYEHFLRGELAYAAGDWGRAAEEFRAARAGPEDDPFLIARLADCFDRLGREARALALLDEGASLDPDSELLHMARGHIHARHERMDEATAAFARASAAAPESEAGPLALSAVLRDAHPGEANAVLERYLSRVGDRASSAGAARARLRLFIERGDALGAVEAVREILRVAPTRAAEIRDAAQTALDRGQPELALRLTLALPPQEAPTLELEAALAAGENELARGLLAGWMPSDEEALVRVAAGTLALGDSARAIELARVALSSNGGARARLVLGRALRAHGDRAQAVRVLSRIEPGSQAWPDAPIELARTLQDASATALAAEVLAEAHRRRPSPELRLAWGRARGRAGDIDGALATLAGDAAPLLAARAQILEAAGREPDPVYRALPADAVDVSPRDRVRAQAEQRWEQGRTDEARALLDAWLERAPEDRATRARRERMQD
ncbi:MAG: tetratricopeptide repeat protein [Sandaracinaceae bacterium]